jgi:nitrite reductase/ring-hydroxylating ferredoxin subunit
MAIRFATSDKSTDISPFIIYCPAGRRFSFQRFCPSFALVVRADPDHTKKTNRTACIFKRYRYPIQPIRNKIPNMPQTSDPEPGYARAAGPSIADTLARDRKPGPDPLLEQGYEFLGDVDIPFSRYTSRTWFEEEMDKLWPKTWQWACREEHLPESGDHYVYEIGPYSVIVVRSAQDRIQAFLNSCTHRGTRILAAAGCGYSAAFTCPFHGWSWELDGRLRNIPARWDFPHADDNRHSLREVRCERWGGFVFINMDPEAAPLHNYLDVLPEHFSHFPLDKRRITVHVEKILP